MVSSPSLTSPAIRSSPGALSRPFPIPHPHRQLGQQTVQVPRKVSWAKPLSASWGPDARTTVLGQTPEHRPAPKDPRAGQSEIGGDGSREIPEGTLAAEARVFAYRATGSRTASDLRLDAHGGISNWVTLVRRNFKTTLGIPVISLIRRARAPRGSYIPTHTTLAWSQMKRVC